MRRSWIIAATAAVGLALAGCTGGGREEDGGYRGITSAYLEPTHRTTTGEEPSGPRPPQSTLSYGGRTVTGLLGTYTWTGGAVDAVGARVADEEEALAVPAGSVVVFGFGGSVRPGSVRAVAYPIGRGNEVRSHHGLRFLRPKEGRRVLASEDLEVRREDDRTEMLAELRVGEYVVEVSVRTPKGYDAFYSFRVAVEGDERKGPGSGDPSN